MHFVEQKRARTARHKMAVASLRFLSAYCGVGPSVRADSLVQGAAYPRPALPSGTQVQAQSSAPLLMMRRAVGMTTYALGRRISEAGRLVTTTVCRCGSAKSGSFSFFQSCKAAEILVHPWAHRLRCVSTELSFHFLGPPPATA